MKDHPIMGRIASTLALGLAVEKIFAEQCTCELMVARHWFDLNEMARSLEPASRWEPIESAPKEADEVIVGWWHSGVWITRAARYRSEDDVKAAGPAFDSTDVGWWSRYNYLGQELIHPTHWLCVVADLPAEQAKA